MRNLAYLCVCDKTLPMEEQRFVIARQHALHAERDIAMAFLSVCLSVCLCSAAVVSKQNGYIVTLLWSIGATAR